MNAFLYWKTLHGKLKIKYESQYPLPFCATLTPANWVLLIATWERVCGMFDRSDRLHSRSHLFHDVIMVNMIFFF